MSTTTTAEAPPLANENPFLAKAAEEAKKPRKASLLDSVIDGKRVRPVFTVLYGPPGIGKTTWASKAPAPIFLPTERGVDQVGGKRFPMAKTYLEFKQQLHTLDTETHPYQSIVIDTADGLEALIHAAVCVEKKVESIEQVGWQDGYKSAKTKWRSLLGKLVEMSERFNLIVLCHAMVKTFNDPALPNPYDIWQMRLHPSSADALRESCDNILFACYDIEIVKANKQAAKGRGLHSGERVIRTAADTGFEAKNRYQLVDELPLEWQAFEAGVQAFYAKG